MGEGRVAVGVLGAGFAGRRHAERLRTLPGVQVVGVADSDRERAVELAGACGARAVGSVRELLDMGPDCLYVCVPPFGHGEPEELAVAAGVPLYVEKPLATDMATAERIYDLLSQRGHLAMVGYQWRYLDTLQQARALLAQTPARLVLGSWLDKAPRTPWWSRQDRSGGQTVEQVTHLLDVARVLVGEPTTVRALSAQDPSGPGDIAHVTASVVGFDGGAVGSFTATCLLAGGYRMAVELLAPGLAVRLAEDRLTVVDSAGERSCSPAVDPVLEADRAFVAAVRGEPADVRSPYEDALRTHRLACAVAEAARTGETVDLTPSSRT